MKKVLLIGIFLSVGALGEKLPYSPDFDKCIDKSGGNTALMRECSTQEYNRLDKMLNANYRKAMRALDKKLQAKLRNAQRLWLKYRDAKCDLYYSLTGGTLDLLAGDSCLLDMTARKVKELEELASMAELSR